MSGLADDVMGAISYQALVDLAALSAEHLPDFTSRYGREAPKGMLLGTLGQSSSPHEVQEDPINPLHHNRTCRGCHGGCHWVPCVGPEHSWGAEDSLNLHRTGRTGRGLLCTMPSDTPVWSGSTQGMQKTP